MSVQAEELDEIKRDAVTISNPEGNGRFVLVCEHASNFIPEEYKNLGLKVKERDSHIAWDPGALAVAKGLSRELDSPLVATRISRLLYDCNRPPTVKAAIPERSEIYDIKGNLNLSKDEQESRAEKFYFPFRNAISECLGSHTRRTGASILVTIHTFTPVFHGRKRLLHMGVLHDSDSRMADGILSSLGQIPSLTVKRNQPYGPRDGVTHTLKEHGTKRGIANVMIEIRNDLVETPEQQSEMISNLVAAITSAADNLNARMG